MSKRGMSRRGFAAAVAGAPLLAQQAQTPPAGAPNPNTSVQQQRRFGPPPEVIPFEAPIEFTRKDVKAKIEPFPMSQRARHRRDI